MTIKRARDQEASQRAECWLSDHGDFLFRYAKSRIWDMGSAEDLVQETLLTAIRKYEQFRGESSERTWLTGILRFKILEYLKRRAAEKKAFSTAPLSDERESWFDEEGHWNHELKSAGMDWNPDPSKVLEQKEFWEVLRRCMSKLPPKTAAVFSQRELEFLESEEIQNDLNITESNLWVLLHRARNQLRHCIQTHWQWKKND